MKAVCSQFRLVSAGDLVALGALMLLVPGLAVSQPPSQTELEQWTAAGAETAYLTLFDLLRIPNDAHFSAQVASNAEHMRGELVERGFMVRELETVGPPLLLAERGVAGALRTVLIYLQIDGQPVDASRWQQEDPYEPVLREVTADGWVTLPLERLRTGEVDPEWRIFARSASDAKGPVAMLLAALDILAARDRAPDYGLKLILDFEEELGSPHLPQAVARHREALAADWLVILDGPRHETNQPTLTFGARGIATVTLTVFGPRVPQHSGHFGNWVPNPAQRLADLLAGMKDDNGRVTLPGFYDGVVLEPEVVTLLAETPDDEVAMLERLGIAEPERVGETYQQALQYPALNVRGLAAGWVGEQVRTIVPEAATAELDLRLVPESDAERLVGLVRQHVESQGYHVLDGRGPTDEERSRYDRIAAFSSEISYGAFRTPYDSEVGRWLTRALERAFGQPPVRIRMAGGSIPISPFVRELALPAVSVPTVNPDNNQHSPDENLRVGNFLEGIRTVLAILTEPTVG